MIIGKSGDTYSIHNENRYNQYDFSFDDILAFVITQGYTSFLLVPYYSNGGYWILMCNPTLDSGGLYLLDYEPNADLDTGGFYSTESSPYRNRWVVATSSSSLAVYNSLSIALAEETYQSRTYTRTQQYLSDMHGLEYVFGTSLNYSKVYVNNIDVTPVSAITSNGGGATHIAKRAGLLSSIGASNLSDILMVSGGGGGGLIIGEDTYAGKDAGGISGSGNNSANQTTGYAFGQGESGDGVSGGGGGLYGGYKGGT